MPSLIVCGIRDTVAQPILTPLELGTMCMLPMPHACIHFCILCFVCVLFAFVFVCLSVVNVVVKFANCVWNFVGVGHNYVG